jgi:FtsZ-interacting cell division protein ZipA
MKDSVKLYQRARALLQSEKAALTKALIAAQSKAADAKKRLAEIVAALSGTGSAPVERLGRPKKKSAKRGRPAKKKSAKRGRPAKKKSAKRGRPAKKNSAKKAVKKAPAKKAVKKAPAKKAVKKAPAKKAVKKAPAKKAVKKAPAKKAKNERSLKEVVLEVTKGKALNAAEIVNAAEKAGHKFSGNNPKNSLRVMLYSNRKLFKNNKGKFTAA